MKFLYASVALLSAYSVAAKYRIDGGVDADFNLWPFVCRLTYGRNITGDMTGTCVLVQFGQKYYAITAGHLLAKTSPDTVNEFIETNLRIRFPRYRYASIVAGVVRIDFGSANDRSLSSAVIYVDENTLKLPLQFIDTLRDVTNMGFAYDFITIEILNHQWYEQRNAKFLDIVRWGYTTQEPAMQCKIAGWGYKNEVFAASLQQTEVHMLDKNRCEFYLDHWSDQFHGCVTMSYIGDPVCYASNPNSMIRAGDSGGPIMCEHKNKTMMVAIQVGTADVLIGRQNISISTGAPMATIKEFLGFIN